MIEIRITGEDIVIFFGCTILGGVVGGIAGVFLANKIKDRQGEP